MPAVFTGLFYPSFLLQLSPAVALKSLQGSLHHPYPGPPPAWDATSPMPAGIVEVAGPSIYPF